MNAPARNPDFTHTEALVLRAFALRASGRDMGYFNDPASCAPWRTSDVLAFSHLLHAPTDTLLLAFEDAIRHGGPDAATIAHVLRNRLCTE